MPHAYQKGLNGPKKETFLNEILEGAWGFSNKIRVIIAANVHPPD